MIPDGERSARRQEDKLQSTGGEFRNMSLELGRWNSDLLTSGLNSNK